MTPFDKLTSLVLTEGSSDTRRSARNKDNSTSVGHSSCRAIDDKTWLSCQEFKNFPSSLNWLILSRLNWKIIIQRPTRICIHFLFILNRDKVISVKWINSRAKIVEISSSVFIRSIRRTAFPKRTWIMEVFISFSCHDDVLVKNWITEFLRIGIFTYFEHCHIERVRGKENDDFVRLQW